MQAQQLRLVKKRFTIPCTIRLGCAAGNDRLEALVTAAQRLHAHRRQHPRERCDLKRLMPRERRHFGRYSHTLQDGEVFFGVQTDRCHAGFVQGDIGSCHSPSDVGVP